MAEVKQKAKKSKKQRKHGRGLRGNANCKVYAVSHRREHNKLRRLKKHLQRFAADKCALDAVARCKAILGVRG
jgi:hypothetical protein